MLNTNFLRTATTVAKYTNHIRFFSITAVNNQKPVNIDIKRNDCIQHQRKLADNEVLDTAARDAILADAINEGMSSAGEATNKGWSLLGFNHILYSSQAIECFALARKLDVNGYYKEAIDCGIKAAAAAADNAEIPCLHAFKIR